MKSYKKHTLYNTIISPFELVESIFFTFIFVASFIHVPLSSQVSESMIMLFF